MAGPSNKKRHFDKPHRPGKKQRKLQNYDSDSDDIHEAPVDVASALEHESSSDDDAPAPKKAMNPKRKQDATHSSGDSDGPSEEGEEDSNEDSDAGSEPAEKRVRMKRNDPTAFANSLSKILSTKVPASKRADPLLARSAEAKEASRAAVDNALEAKARKQMRDEKRKALEKGRVRDVLVATRNESTGEMETTTVKIMETERRLRKVAQRGVLKLFNAVRAAQVAAADAEKGATKDGVIGVTRREEKVNELSKKGFLDLIASGGGGLKKGGLEEA